MLAVARDADVRILGPNCVGMLRPSIGLNASFARTACEAGSIALVSQSGAICTALVDWAASTKVGLSSVVSLGAAADIDFGDVLDYLLFDNKTESVLLYVEGVHNGRTFISSLRAIARAKPVIVLKVGRYASGSQAARSHTGALVGNDAVFDAVLARCGVVRVHSAQDLFAAARALSSRRKPYGDRLAIVTNGGGPGVLAADAVSSENLQLAKLAPETLERLNAILPKHWSHNNPVDVIGDANGERFGGAAKIVAADPNVDAVLTVFCPTGIASAESVADGILPVAKECAKPFLTAWLGESGVVDTRHRVEAAGIPAYRAGEVAVQAFAALASHVKNQRLLLESPPPRSTTIEHDIVRAEEILQGAIDEKRTMLNEVEAKSLLAAFGIPVPPFVVAKTREEAAGAADAIGYPVVMKILSPDISHKSDVNGVRLDVRDSHDVVHQFDDIIATVKRLRPEASITGVLVQSMVARRDGRELMIGVMTDPSFGPAISFGSGGVAVELLRDNAIGLPPLNVRLAGDLIDRTRAARLLGAYRNVPAANREALIDVLLRVSDIVCALPWIAEMDINPLLLDPTGAVALDARIIVDPARRHLDSRYSHLAIHPYPEALEAVERLRDGTDVTIRPIRPEDAEMETAFITELSDESRYLRFLLDRASRDAGDDRALHPDRLRPRDGPHRHPQRGRPRVDHCRGPLRARSEPGERGVRDRGGRPRAEEGARLQAHGPAHDARALGGHRAAARAGPLVERLDAGTDGAAGLRGIPGRRRPQPRGRREEPLGAGRRARRAVLQGQQPSPSRLGHPSGRCASGSGQRFTSQGERCRKQVRKLDAAPSAQKAKKPTE